MAEHIEQIEPIENDSDELEESSSVDEATVKGWVKDAIESILAEIPGEGTVQPERDLEAPVTLREMERIARETVEAAMAPLREAPKKKVASKPKPKPEAEPEAAPINKEIKNKLQKFLWGEE
jgi:hypothetical protein